MTRCQLFTELMLGLLLELGTYSAKELKNKEKTEREEGF
jgi:hypothetical protein